MVLKIVIRLEQFFVININNERSFTMKEILDKYNLLCNRRSDINEHLPTLKEYTEKCSTVTEFGVRGIVSSYGFLAGKPKRLFSYDITPPSRHGGNLDIVYKLTAENNIDYKFIQADTLTIDIEQTDLLFIDTYHTYDQLTQELARHSNKVNKYIIFHDTVLFGYTDQRYDPISSKKINTQNKKIGLMPAILEFLENEDWVLEKEFKNNNGLLIIKKIIE